MHDERFVQGKVCLGWETTWVCYVGSLIHLCTGQLDWPGIPA